MLDEHGARMSKRDGSMSAGAYRAIGVSADQLLGQMMFGLGLIDQEAAITACDLIAELSLSDVEAVLSHA